MRNPFNFQLFLSSFQTSNKKHHHTVWNPLNYLQSLPSSLIPIETKTGPVWPSLSPLLSRTHQRRVRRRAITRTTFSSTPTPTPLCVGGHGGNICNRTSTYIIVRLVHIDTAFDKEFHTISMTILRCVCQSCVSLYQHSIKAEQVKASKILRTNICEWRKIFILGLRH